jgi:hypothetical protein
LVNAPVPNTLNGMMVHILAGLGAGQARIIASHDSVTFTLTKPWDIIPDKTSFWVIMDATWSFTSPSQPVTQYQPTPATISMPVNVTNLQYSGLLIQVDTVSADTSKKPGIASIGSPQRIVWLNRISAVNAPPISQLAGMQPATFVFGDGGDVQTGVPSGPVTANVGGTFTAWQIAAGTAPVGSDMIFDIMWTPSGGDPTTDAVSIFSMAGPWPDLTDSTYQAEGYIFAGQQTLSKGDMLSAVATQVGAGTAGQNVNLTLYWG